jgi:3-dehydrotetronate 4-kinase
MDTMVRGIDAVVVAELRAAGYMESTVGQYAKTIKALTEFTSGREYSTYWLDPRTVERTAALYPDASAWLTENLGATPVLKYSAAAASESGPADPAAATDLESMMGALAALAVAAGAHRIVVAGGETSGAIVDALGIKAVVVNAEMDTGVPWCSTVDDDPVTLPLKSGNFGKQDLPVRAATVTEL